MMHANLFLGYGQGVGRDIVFALQIGITREAEWIRSYHLQPWEQHIEMDGDNLLQPDEIAVYNLAQTRLVIRLYVILVGNAYQAWAYVFHFDPGKALPPERIVDDDGQIETEMRDVRKRMRRIASERCQYRKNFAREILRDKRPLFGPQFTVVEDVNASRAELRQHVMMPALGVPSQVCHNRVSNRGQLFRWPQAIGRHFQHSLLSRAYLTPVELVQVLVKRARNLTRSRSGWRSSMASSRTRQLHCSQLIARLREREGASRSAVVLAVWVVERMAAQA